MVFLQSVSMILGDRWYSLATLLACKTSAANKIHTLIWDGYQQFFRCYHGLNHLADCFIHFDEIRHRLDQPAVAEYALWFHDIVCVPNSQSNEYMSAAVAAYAAEQMGLPTAFAGQAAKLILLTSHQELAESEDGKYLADIDLSVFGREWNGFLDYEHQIRAEYGHVPDLDYRQGRLQVIEGFLSKDSIYQTDYFRNRYESIAERNLQALVKQLASQ
ncbi:hypothetical protein [Sporomusa paucivorans]|uniref:HD domain-containing protein n=2 Tax=Sporomusa TaxID=2375 RepID=UPI00315B7A54